MTFRPSIVILTVTPLLLMNLWILNVLSPVTRFILSSTSETELSVLPPSSCKTAPMTGGRDASASTTAMTPHSKFLIPFDAPPELHNTTVQGATLPGLFYNNRLYLLGARLTTSYDDDSVHMDLFGFPGDWFTRITSHDPDQPGCKKGSNATNNKYDRLLSYQQIQKSVRLYSAVECADGAPCGGDHSDSSDKIRMELLPMRSGDINQEDVSLIWRCNLTSVLQRHTLRDAAAVNPRQAVRVAFWVEETLIVQQSTLMVPLLSADIPLATAIVGHAGPQVYHTAAPNYFEQSTNQTVGLCADIYGTDVHKYLPEFVQHHINVGVDQIVLGVETTLGSNEFSRVRSILLPYMQSGLVLLQATQVAANDEFECYFDFHKLHFYHQCLYHFKGLAKYSATWDVDEFWVPPKSLDTSGSSYETLEHEHQGFVGRRRLGEALKLPNPVKANPNNNITKSHPSRFAALVTRDPLWQASPYAHSVSIRDVMEGINHYHSNHGCGAAWCYHLFPSYVVHLLKQVADDGSYRTHRQVNDFLKRDKQVLEKWQKGVANTQVAMMSGIHIPGSCRHPDDDEYRMFAKDESCLPHRFDPDVYGGMHHFLSLIRDRDSLLVRNKRNLPEDEYVTIYAETVSKQLDRLYGIRGAGRSVSTTSTRT